MPRKPKEKRGPGNRYPDSVKREAKKIYLTEGASDREIAERLGVKRIDTIRDWRTREQWGKDRDAVAEKTTEKTIEKIATAEAEINARHSTLFRNLEALGNAIIAGCIDKATGEIIPPDAKELRAVASAMRDCQAGQRLANNMPDRVTEQREPKSDEPPDFSAMTDAELDALAEGRVYAPLVVDAAEGPTNGSGRKIH